jgi:hypothetical protein
LKIVSEKGAKAWVLAAVESFDSSNDNSSSGGGELGAMQKTKRTVTKRHNVAEQECSKKIVRECKKYQNRGSGARRCLKGASSRLEKARASCCAVLSPLYSSVHAHPFLIAYQCVSNYIILCIMRESYSG